MTVIQRFGSGLQLNVHAHALFLDGVFTEAAAGTLRFHPAPPPTDLEVARLVATIRTRVLRLLRRRGVLLDAADDGATDPLAETSLALAGITSAAVQGCSALGPRAGARVLQVGRVPGALWVTTTGSRQAHLDGFDLHANAHPQDVPPREAPHDQVSQGVAARAAWRLGREIERHAAQPVARVSARIEPRACGGADTAGVRKARGLLEVQRRVTGGTASLPSRVRSRARRSEAGDRR